MEASMKIVLTYTSLKSKGVFYAPRISLKVIGASRPWRGPPGLP
ncbi:MAG: hypothetical protein QXH61_05070 [Candidatus Nezhaarchaeales archaeon]